MATSSMQKSKPNGKPALSLLDFNHNKKVEQRKRDCVICRLPQGVRDEIKLARTRKVERAVIIEWLSSLKYKLDDVDFQTHSAGLHDSRELRGRE